MDVTALLSCGRYVICSCSGTSPVGMRVDNPPLSQPVLKKQERESQEAAMKKRKKKENESRIWYNTRHTRGCTSIT